MRKSDKDRERKQHFELSPANKKRMDAYIEAFNEDPERVTPRLKIGDVVNAALDAWLSKRPIAVDSAGAAKAAKGSKKDG